MLLLLLLIILKVVCFLLGKVADCSSFFQLCVKNVFTFSGIKDWKRVKFLTKACFHGGGGLQIGKVTCAQVTPPIM